MASRAMASRIGPRPALSAIGALGESEASIAHDPVAIARGVTGVAHIDDLARFVEDEIARIPSWEAPVAASLKKDVDCLLRMYAPRVAGRFALDDLLDCPFREMGLLETVWDDVHRYRFVIGAKPTLPAEIVSCG